MEEFIQREQAKQDRKLLSLLRKVMRTGFVGKEATEVLLVNGLIEFGGPNSVNRYNHYHLSEQGSKEYLRLTGVKL